MKPNSFDDAPRKPATIASSVVRRSNRIRHDREDLRNSMETARLTAEHTRDATVAAMRASTDALDASVDHSSVVDGMRDYQTLREPD